MYPEINIQMKKQIKPTMCPVTQKKFSRTARLGSMDKFISLKQIETPTVARRPSDINASINVSINANVNSSHRQQRILSNTKEQSLDDIIDQMHPESPGRRVAEPENGASNGFGMLVGTWPKANQNNSWKRQKDNDRDSPDDKERQLQWQQQNFQPKTRKTKRDQDIPNTESVKIHTMRDPTKPGNTLHNKPFLTLKERFGYDDLHPFDAWTLKEFQIDPRDYKLLIPFFQQLTCHQSKLSLRDQETIRKWLSSVYQSVSSDAFLKYLHQQLTTPEVKVYASKNYILNIHKLMQKINFGQRNKEYRQRVFKFINEESKKIVQNLKNRYPQASQAGGSCRKFKKTIGRPDNSESLRYELFYAKSGQKIEFKYNEAGDYIPAIMKTLNYLIGSSSEGFIEENDMLTKYQAFEMMMTYIFKHSRSADKFFVDNSSQKSSYSIYTSYNSMESQRKNFWERAQYFQKKFDDFTGDQAGHNKFHTKKSHEISDQLSFNIGKKISDDVQLFTQQQIQTGDITIRDGALLRIVTKWVQQLRQKLSDPQQHILNRVEFFKTTTGQLVQLNTDLKKLLCDCAKQQEKRITQIFGTMQEHYIKLQQQIFSLNYSGTYLNGLDTNLGIISGRTGLCMGQYMVVYLNHLIHSLCRIPLEAAKRLATGHEKRGIVEAIDLITFKLGDLMRAKVKSKENEIISIYKFLQMMSEKIPQVLKIVKLKDRLDKKDKDVLITFMFMNQIKCQVQLSIDTQVDIRQKKSNQFNHYLYQLQRAQFGPIAQAACIIAKYDPLFQKNFRKILQQSKLTEKCVDQLKQIQLQLSLLDLTKNRPCQKVNIIEADSELPFFCERCKKLIENRNPEFFKKRIHTDKYQECNDCAGLRIMEMNQKTLTLRSIELNNFITGLNNNTNISGDQEEGFENSEVELIKELFRGSFEVNSLEMKMIVKHFRVERKDRVLAVQQKGIIIAKNTKRPIPLFYKTIIYQGTLHFLTASNISSEKSQARSILSINLKVSSQKAKSKLSDYYFLKSSTAFFQQLKVKQEILLKCTCCELESFKISQFFGYENILYDDNMKFLHKVKKNQKQTLYLNERVLTDELYNIGVMVNIKRFYAQNANFKDMNFLFGKTSQGKNSDKYDTIEKFANIQYLNVSSNRILEIIGLKSLRILKCSDNGIKSIENISKSQVLTELDISYNNLSSLKGIEHFPALVYLNCVGNLIQAIDRQAYNLETLEINLNKLTSLKGVNSMPSLVTLKAADNFLQELGFARDSPSLVTLDVSSNSLKTLFSMQFMPSLKTLICNSNPIDEISKLCLGQPRLPSLEHLQICACLLKSLQGIQNFKRLKILHCKGNKISSLELETLCHCIQELYIEENQLVSLNGVQIYLNLRFLNACYNKIGTLRFDNIKKLDIPVLMDFPMVLAGLEISYNRIRSLDGIEKFSNLKKLSCQNNKIDQLGIRREIPKLEEIYMRGNHLDNFNGIQHFKSLKKLQCYANPIHSYMPLTKLQKLCEIDIGEVKHTSLSYLNQLKHAKKVKGFCRIAQSEQQVYKKYPILSNFQQFSIQELIKLPVPEGDQKIFCAGCSNSLKSFPFYYCPWGSSSGFQYRCRQCIQSPDQWTVYSYLKNSILLLESLQSKVLKKRIGKNLQPAHPARAPFQQFTCRFCKQKMEGSTSMKSPRYLCLMCKPEVEAVDFIDMCMKCMQKYLDKNKNGEVKKELEKYKHCWGHPWLRILFGGKGYREY